MQQQLFSDDDDDDGDDVNDIDQQDGGVVTGERSTKQNSKYVQCVLGLVCALCGDIAPLRTV